MRWQWSGRGEVVAVVGEGCGGGENMRFGGRGEVVVVVGRRGEVVVGWGGGVRGWESGVGGV